MKLSDFEFDEGILDYFGQRKERKAQEQLTNDMISYIRRGWGGEIPVLKRINPTRDPRITDQFIKSYLAKQLNLSAQDLSGITGDFDQQLDAAVTRYYQLRSGTYQRPSEKSAAPKEEPDTKEQPAKPRASSTAATPDSIMKMAMELSRKDKVRLFGMLAQELDVKGKSTS